MIIIQKDPNTNGTHNNQTWPDEFLLPDGYVGLDYEMEVKWNRFKPYVTLSIDQAGALIDILDNPSARDAGENQPIEPGPIDPLTQRLDDNDELILDMLYRMTLLEWGVN